MPRLVALELPPRAGGMGFRTPRSLDLPRGNGPFFSLAPALEWASVGLDGWCLDCALRKPALHDGARREIARHIDGLACPIKDPVDAPCGEASWALRSR